MSAYWLLDTNETWTYEASETAQEGLQTNKGTVTADPLGGSGQVMDMDPANYTGVTPPAIPGDLCDVLGKPVALVFRYDPNIGVNNNQNDKFDISGTTDNDPTAFISAGDGKGGQAQDFHAVALNANARKNGDLQLRQIISNKNCHSVLFMLISHIKPHTNLSSKSKSSKRNWKILTVIIY